MTPYCKIFIFFLVFIFLLESKVLFNLNAGIWLADERSEVCTIFREAHGERSSGQLLTALPFRITSPNYFS